MRRSRRRCHRRRRRRRWQAPKCLARCVLMKCDTKSGARTHRHLHKLCDSAQNYGDACLSITV